MHAKGGKIMPNVKKNRNAGMKFPYTKEGIAQAKSYSMQSGGKVELDKMEMGGMIKQYMGGGMVKPMMPKYPGGGKVMMSPAQKMAMAKMMYGGKIKKKKG